MHFAGTQTVCVECIEPALKSLAVNHGEHVGIPCGAEPGGLVGFRVAERFVFHRKPEYRAALAPPAPRQLRAGEQNLSRGQHQFDAPAVAR